MNDIMIELKNLSVGYDKPVLRDLNLKVGKGEYWGIIGPNGAGKSTLIKTLLGLIPALQGEFFLNNGDSDRFCYVPQHSTMQPDYPLTVREIVLMPRMSFLPFKKPDAETELIFERNVEFLGLKKLILRSFRDLSGGERQKVLLCRALMMRSSLLVLDEPTNGMDIGSEAEIISLVRDLNRNEGYTVLFITHIITHLLNEASHFALLHGLEILQTDGRGLREGDFLQRIYGREMCFAESDGYCFLRPGLKKNAAEVL